MYKVFKNNYKNNTYVTSTLVERSKEMYNSNSG